MPVDQNLLDALDAVIAAKVYTETQRRIAKQLHKGEGRPIAEGDIRKELADGAPLMAAATFRKHLELFNTKLKEHGGGFMLRLSKGAVVAEVSLNPIEEQLRNVSDSVRARMDMSKLVPPRASLSDPSRDSLLVFFSHAWLKPDVQHDIQIDFYDRLEARLKNPPALFKHLPVIKLWRDKNEISPSTGGIKGLTPQCLKACKDAFLALVMASYKHPHSETCKEELAVFVDANGNDMPGKQTIVIPVNIKSHADLPKNYGGGERLLPHFKSGNLLDWASAPEAEKDRYVRAIADEIFKAAEGLSPSPLSSHVSDDGVLAKAEHDLGNHVREQRALDSGLKRAELITGKATRAANMRSVDAGSCDAASIDIVDELLNWAGERRGPRITALLGEFGMGKTTTCQLFTEQLLEKCKLDKTLPLPIYLDLRNLQGLKDPGNTDLVDFLPSLLKAHFPDKTPDAAKLLEYVRKEGCIVVFDGLDEVTNKMTKDEAQRLYRRLLEVIPAAEMKAARTPDDTAALTGPRLVISCRSHYFKDVHDQAGFLLDRDRASLMEEDIALYFMLPFTPEAIREYFVKRIGEDGADKAIDMISGNAGLAEIAGRPVLLKMLHEVLPELDQQLIAGRTIDMHAVYELFVNRAIQRDSGKWTVREDDKMQLLGDLALHLWHIQSESMDAKALGKWLENTVLMTDQFPVLKEMVKGADATIGFELILQDMRNAALLVRAGEVSFRFAHASLREFFLAEALHRHIGEKRLDLSQEGKEPAFISDETLSFLESRQLACVAQTEGRSFVAGYPRLVAQGRPIAERQLGVQLLVRERLGLVRPEIVDCSGLSFSFGGDGMIYLTQSRMQLLMGEGKIATRVTDFTGAKLLSLTFGNVDFAGVNWSLADLRETLFIGCKLESDSFLKAALQQTVCRDCTFTDGAPPSDGMRLLVSQGGKALEKPIVGLLLKAVLRKRVANAQSHVRAGAGGNCHYISTYEALIGIDRDTGATQKIFDLPEAGHLQPTADGKYWHLKSYAGNLRSNFVLDMRGQKVAHLDNEKSLIFQIFKNGDSATVLCFNLHRKQFEQQFWQNNKLFKQEKIEIGAFPKRVISAGIVCANIVGETLHVWSKDGLRTSRVLDSAEKLDFYNLVSCPDGDQVVAWSNTHACAWSLDGRVVRPMQLHGHNFEASLVRFYGVSTAKERVIVRPFHGGDGSGTKALDETMLYELTPEGPLLPLAKAPQWWPQKYEDVHHSNGWLITDDFAVDFEAYVANGFDPDKPVAMRFIAGDNDGNIGHLALEPDAAGKGYVATHVSPEAYRFFYGVMQDADGVESLCPIEALKQDARG
jgi:hypothetical protein